MDIPSYLHVWLCVLKICFKRNRYTFKVDISVKTGFAALLKKGLHLKMSHPLFRRGLVCKKSKEEVTKVVSLLKRRKSTKYIQNPLKATQRGFKSCPLIYYSLKTPKRVIDKQYRPRSESPLFENSSTIFLLQYLNHIT